MIANCLNAALIDDVLEASAFPGVNISCPKNQWRLGLFASLGHFLCVSDAGSIKDHRGRRTNCYWPGPGFPLRVGSTLPMCSRRWRKLVGRGMAFSQIRAWPSGWSRGCRNSASTDFGSCRLNDVDVTSIAPLSGLHVDGPAILGSRNSRFAGRGSRPWFLGESPQIGGAYYSKGQRRMA